jgi:integrase
MSDWQYIEEKDFEFVGQCFNAKNRHLIDRAKIHKNRKWYKVYYCLPTGSTDVYYGIPRGLNKTELKSFLVEFKSILNYGYIPRSGVLKMRSSGFILKDGDFDLFFERYFNDFAVGKRTKNEDSISSTKSTVRRIFDQLKGMGKKSISDLSDEDISSWSHNLMNTKKLNSEGIISPATRVHYRKNLKALLRTAKQNGYSLQCDPERLQVEEFGKNGKVDKKKNARHIIFPEKLILAIENCSYPDPADPYEFNIKKLPRFLQHTGLRPGELYNLCEQNLSPNKFFPLNIIIKNLESIPNRGKTKFTPKTGETRTIPLTEYCKSVLSEIVDKLGTEKRFGQHKGSLQEFPFLFVFRDERTGRLVRGIKKLNEKLFDVINHAMKEFNLTLEDVGLSKDVPKFELYDLRRACNYRLKVVMSYTDSGAAEFLGHTVNANLQHYTIPKDFAEINAVRVNSLLQKAIQSSAQIAEEYSSHISKDAR